MRKLLILLLLIGVVSARAQQQQFMIHYDLKSTRTSYFKIGEKDTAKIRNISLRQSGRVILKVDNYNPFYWNAKVTTYRSPVQDENSYTNAFNPFSFLASNFSGLMSIIPKIDLPVSRGGYPDNANGRFLNTASDYAENYAKLQQLSEQYDQLQLAKLQLKELKFDNNKSAEEIKAEAKSIVEKTLGTDSISLVRAITIGKQMNTELTNALAATTTLNAQLQQQLTEVNANEKVEGQTFKQIALETGNSAKEISRFKSLTEKNPAFLMDEVNEVASLYRDIENASFNFLYSINTEPDLSYLKLELYPKTEATKDTLVQYFPLHGRRSLKIRNSVGAAFTYFSANNTNYFVGADSVIKKSSGDLFNPLIATFIHFYSGNTSGFKWGGTFGFGIPISGEKKDVNFMLGLTTAFGQNEPVLLSFGLSGGKVNKLTNGYELGQKTRETNADKLVTSSYDIGGFLSLTFNLSSLGRK